MSGPDPWLTWSAPIDRSLLVEEGMVICPHRGVVELETCLACEYLIGVEGEWDARVLCSYPVPAATRQDAEADAAPGEQVSRPWHRVVADPFEPAEEIQHPEDLLPGDVRPEREAPLPGGHTDPWGVDE